MLCGMVWFGVIRSDESRARYGMVWYGQTRARYGIVR
jgi:hypothetical protein